MFIFYNYNYFILYTVLKIHDWTTTRVQYTRTSEMCTHWCTVPNRSYMYVSEHFAYWAQILLLLESHPVLMAFATWAWLRGISISWEAHSALHSVNVISLSVTPASLL